MTTLHPLTPAESRTDRDMPRSLLNPDGSTFEAELTELRERLIVLSNPERVSYRNENARAIAQDASPRLLVVAGPGSGKSFLFLDRIRFWLTTGASSIYVSSFVRKLVRDLQNEIETRIGEAGRGVTATTLHTLARSLIERNHGTSELPLREHIAVMAGWTELVWRDVLAFHPELSRSDYPLRAFETQLFDDEPSDSKEWRALAATYDTLRCFYNAVGFADMIRTARVAVEENPALIEHSHWIFDEFQDFNAAEEQLVCAVTEGASGLLLAGDDEQALYQALKHSHPEIIISYYGNPEFAKAMLPYCGRCSYYVCQAACAFIEHHREADAIAKIYLPLEEDPGAEKVQVVAAATPSSAVDYVRGFIKSRRSELEQHRAAMEAGEETDPFLLILTPERQVRFYKSRDADTELRDLVAEWSNPAINHSRDYWKIADYNVSAGRPSDNFALRKILDHEDVSVDDVHELLVEALDGGVNLADLDSQVIREALEQCRAVAAIIDSESLAAHEQAEQCAELLQLGNLDRLAAEIEADPISSSSDEGNEAIETSAGGSPVELLTIVGAKGLSAKHVIVLGCDNVNLGRTTPLAFYVALTRARKSLHLLVAAKAGGATAPHEFLLDLPEDCCEYLVHKKSGAPEVLANASALEQKFATWAWVARKGPK
jgi:hypothetical protein